MKSSTLKALTNAHAWIGLIISSVLFVVFFAGSISLFRANINAWELMPHLVEHVDETSSDTRYDQAIKVIQQQYTVDVHHVFLLYPPTEKHPFIQAFFAAELDEPDPITGSDHIDKFLNIHPYTGEIISDASKHTFATFVYRLHYDIGLGRTGLYFVGIITLFFFVALLTGVIIHWRKIAQNFFQYRKEKTKDKWLDAHNLIGTMGLPFHIMYAFTGLVFNLVIIYQISYALILYQGDQNKLLHAAGFDQPHIEEADTRAFMKDIDELYIKAKSVLGEVELEHIQVEHFGDKNAVVAFVAENPNYFSTAAEVHFRLDNGAQVYVTHDNYDNNVRSGLAVIASLHFGDFAGYGLRIAFFLLGLATCYIIVTGNLMWILKRQKQKKQSKRSLAFVTRLTTGSFIGIAFAIAVGFIFARVLPDVINDRMYYVKASVFISFFVSLLIAQCITNQVAFTKYFLRLTGLTYFLAIVVDWGLYGTQIWSIIQLAYLDIILVHVMLGFIALLCFYFATKCESQSVLKNTSNTQENLSLHPEASTL